MGDVLDQVTTALNNTTVVGGGFDANAKIWTGSASLKNPLPGSPVTSAKSEHTPQELINQFAKWKADGDPKYAAIRNNLIASGLLYGSRTVANNWTSVQSAFASAISMYQQSSQKSDFGTWLDTSAKLSAATGGSGAAYSGPVTTRSVQITDATSAAALLNKLSTDMLGRNLTHDELTKYTAQLNKVEVANPQVNYSDGKGPQQSSRTTTAPDKTQVLHDILAKDSNYAENQIDTSVMDLFVNHIKKGQAILNG